MWHNFQRFTLGAILYASLSLFLFGCGARNGASTVPAPNTLKTVSGIVSDITTGLPISNATVAAYAVDANGTVIRPPLSIPATTKSDGWGYYSLKIPVSYTGMVLIEATVGSAKAVAPQKQVAATPGTVIRNLLPSIFTSTTVNLNLATEMVYEYIVQNKGSVFTAANAQEAVLMLEPFFGPNFAQISPPSLNNAPTQAQENLVVTIQAVDSLLSPTVTIASLVKIDPATGKIGLGSTTNLAALNAAITAATTELTNSGTISSTYVAPPITPVTQTTVITSLSDTTSPVGPTTLTYDEANSTYSKVVLTWNAATDNVAVTAYYVYRDGDLIGVVAAPTLTYSDSTVSDSTTYVYQVVARDAAGNLSTGATRTVTTKAIPTYSISGKVTLNGTALPNVNLTLAGSGTGTTKSDTSGNYSFTGVRGGSYTVTPSISGYFFAPTFRLVEVSTANVTGQDFAALPAGTVNGGTTYPDGTVVTTTTSPDGTVTITTRYPDGSVSVTTRYPNGQASVVTTYPNGLVTTTTTYPNGTVTTGTTYPTGSVTTTTTNPDGSVTATTRFPDGSVSVRTSYPDGKVTTTITYPNPSGAVTTTTTTYPNGAVIGGTTYPNGTVITSTTYPDGRVTATVSYPSGMVKTTITYPNPSGTIITGTTYPNPDGTFTTVISYPNGTASTTTSYPNGTVTTVTTYPDGTVSTTTRYPNGMVTTVTTYPNPSGAVTTTVTTYPDGKVTTVTTYSNGTVVSGTTYPNGTSTVVTTYPNGTVTTATSNSDGSVTTTTTYPNGVVTTDTTSYPTGTAGVGVNYPNGALSGTLGYYVIVSGVITDSATHNPIPGVDLWFLDPNNIKTSVRTTFAGTYYFRGQPNTKYYILDQNSNYSFTPGSLTTGAGNYNKDFVATATAP